MASVLYETRTFRVRLMVVGFLVFLMVGVVVAPALSGIYAEPWIVPVLGLLIGIPLSAYVYLLKDGELIVSSEGITVPSRTWGDMLSKRPPTFIPSANIAEVRLMFPGLAVEVVAKDGSRYNVDHRYVRWRWRQAERAFRQMAKVTGLREWLESEDSAVEGKAT